MLETLDYTIRIGSTPTFLYFDLYLYSAYAAYYVYFNIFDSLFYAAAHYFFLNSGLSRVLNLVDRI